MMTTDKELQSYKDAVSAYAREGRDFLFHNKGEEHALIICTSIFDNAQSTVRIVAGDLCRKGVCDNTAYVNALRNFIGKTDTKLSIVLTTPAEKKEMMRSPLFFMLRESKAYKDQRVVVKTSEGKLFMSKSANSSAETIHFCTGDDHMFRIENDLDNCRAIANFGDKKTTKQLNDVFDAGFLSFKEIDLSEVFVVE